MSLVLARANYSGYARVVPRVGLSRDHLRARGLVRPTIVDKK